MKNWYGDRLDPNRRRVILGIASYLSFDASVDGGCSDNVSGVGTTHQGERLRYKLQGICHCARSDAVAVGGVLAVADEDAEYLKPRDGVRPAAEEGVQQVLFTEGRPLPLVGGSSGISSSREARSHRCLDSDKIAAESMLGRKGQSSHGRAQGK
jgi:hypothetical protein